MAGRKSSKSRQTWKYGFETHEQHVARIHATKKNSRKKIKQNKYTKPKEILELKASRALSSKESARKIFEKWLSRDDVTKIAEKPIIWDSDSLTYLLMTALNDVITSRETLSEHRNERKTKRTRKIR